MAASYKPLFKLLIDRNMKKKELAERAGLSLATITKMGKEGTVVTTDVLVKICVALNCEIGDIVESLVKYNRNHQQNQEVILHIFSLRLL